jgi:molybdopterin synthase catalytic subunit
MGQILEEARNLSPPPPLEGSTHQCCTRPPPATAKTNYNSTDLSSSTETAPIPQKIEVNRIHIAHLLGPSPPLNPSIVITVASPHRREAFWLTEWLLERVKERVQVWKREYYAEEESGETTSFVGRDGDGPDGRGGRDRPHLPDEEERMTPGSKWKENFKPENAVKIDK